MELLNTEFDSRLIGEWRSGFLRYIFAYDGVLDHGFDDQRYRLSDRGRRLTMGASTYEREGKNTRIIVGHWIDAANNQEVYYRPDGRTLSLDLNSRFVMSGTYAATPEKLMSAYYTARVRSRANILYYSMYDGFERQGEYHVDGNTLSLVDQNGNSMALTKYQAEA